jgi:hypothetical protein
MSYMRLVLTVDPNLVAVFWTEFEQEGMGEELSWNQDWCYWVAIKSDT